jgi:hypothetical protein
MQYGKVNATSKLKRLRIFWKHQKETFKTVFRRSPSAHQREHKALQNMLVKLYDRIYRWLFITKVKPNGKSQMKTQHLPQKKKKCLTHGRKI